MKVSTPMLNDFSPESFNRAAFTFEVITESSTNSPVLSLVPGVPGAASGEKP